MQKEEGELVQGVAGVGQSTEKHTTIKCIPHLTNVWDVLSTSSMQGTVRGLQPRGGRISSFLQGAAEEAVGRAGFQTQTWVGTLDLPFTLGGT